MVDLSTRLLRSFLVLADELNFTRAATRLMVAQQTLSSQISLLEKTLGVSLLERTTRTVTLTPAGRRLRVEAQEVLASFDAMADSVRQTGGVDRPRIRLGILPGGARSITSDFFAALSDAGFDVELREYSLMDPSCGLVLGETDVALTYVPQTAELATIPIKVDPTVLAMPSRHPWAARASVRAEEVLSEPLVVGPSMDPVWSSFWTLGYLRAEDAEPPVAGRAGSIESSLAMIAAGRGVQVTVATVETDLPRPGIVYVPIDGARTATLVAATRKGDRRPTVLHALQVVQNMVAERDGGGADRNSP